MAKKRRLKAWHMVPLSLIALILVAVFVWVGRGDFSTREVGFYIEGPQQMDNAKATEFQIVVDNKSSKPLKNVNISLELPNSMVIADGREEVERGFAEVLPGESRSIDVSLVASSLNSKEKFSARLDYSPEGVSARFVKITSKEVIIGTLDASIIFDLPEKIFADQEIEGIIHIIPNSDIETTTFYLKLQMPENFELQGTSERFDFDTVWRIGELQKNQAIQREFRGALTSVEGSSPTFRIAIGKLDGASFLELKSVEHTIQISESPLFVEQKLLSGGDGAVSPGERVNVSLSYRNRTEITLEDALLSVELPVDLIDMSTVTAPEGSVDRDTGVIEWSGETASRLQALPVDEGGTFNYSFRVADSIEPNDQSDSNRLLNLDALFRSEQENLNLDGAVLQARDELELKLITDLSLNQSIYRSGGSFENTGPHPPRANELSTYTVRWELSNTTNSVNSARIEAVLPNYAVWENEVNAGNENVRFISSTNTVVWEIGDVPFGLGYIHPQRSVEFKVGVVPEQRDVNRGINILEQTKVTGIDNFTSTFLDTDLGPLTTSD